jgi:ABC-2 type transport system ATP-binding protein
VAAAVEVIDLVVEFGDTVAVRGLSFTADPGQVTAVLGPNGAGKTTTIETCEGYRAPTAGRVRVLGLDPVADRSAVHRRIGVMLQSGGVYPTMTPAQALHLFAAYYDKPLDPEGLLGRVGLEAVRATPWRRLSGGEQQRLSLALALVGRPTVAFLDEPTAGVDPAGRLVIREVIRELRERGVAIVLTTHELEEASRLADRVVIIDRGQVVGAGTPAELMASGGGSDIRFGAPAGIDTASLAARVGGTVVEVQPGEYQVHAGSTPARIAALAGWLAERNLPLADLRAGRQTLEDVFLRLTGASTAELERAPQTGGGRDRGRRRSRHTASTGSGGGGGS